MGGGDKGPAIEEKMPFFGTFFLFVALLSSCGHEGREGEAPGAVNGSAFKKKLRLLYVSGCQLAEWVNNRK